MSWGLVLWVGDGMCGFEKWTGPFVEGLSDWGYVGGSNVTKRC